MRQDHLWLLSGEWDFSTDPRSHREQQLWSPKADVLDAQQHTFQQGADQKVEFGMARRIRIHAEFTNLFETLRSNERTLLAHRILQDVTENGVDLAMVVSGVIEELQECG